MERTEIDAMRQIPLADFLALLGHEPVRRSGNELWYIAPYRSERTIFTMAKFTIPDDKCLVVELNEKNGGRHQSFVIENEDLVRANTINELQVR